MTRPPQPAAVPRPAPRSLVAEARRVVANCPAMAVRLVARRVGRFLDAALADSGLTGSQFGLLALIAAADTDTIGVLAGRAGLDPSTLSRNLQALERAGLVEIAVVERDLRRRAVWLTETGSRRLEAAIPLWHRAQAVLAQALDPVALRRLAAQSGGLDPIPGQTRR